MATTGKGQSRAGFLRELFGRDPRVTLDRAQEAWAAAGNSGEISGSSFYNARADFNKKSGGGRGGRSAETQANGRDPASESEAGGRATAAGDRERAFDEVEAGIDDLIFRLKTAGGAPEVEARLREARRLLHPGLR